MEVRTATGELPKWRDEELKHFFYQGCVLRFLGHGASDPVENPSE